jgi:predicted Zn-ribbon and HTH transcriptional regulator
MELKCPSCGSTKIVYIIKKIEQHRIVEVAPEGIETKNIGDIYSEYVTKPIHCRDCGSDFRRQEFCKHNLLASHNLLC